MTYEEKENSYKMYFSKLSYENNEKKCRFN